MVASLLLALPVLPVSIASACEPSFPTSGSSILRGVDDYQAASAFLRFPNDDPAELNFTGEFIVPPKPTAWDGETQVYLWFGINWYDRSGQCLGVMQPVLTYGCSPNAISGVGCGTNSSDPNYSQDPYWYFSSQYVCGWAVGQAHGSTQVVRTMPGNKIYSEISYNVAADAWLTFARDESTGDSSAYTIHHPLEDKTRSWKLLQRDSNTSATLFAVSEPHQVSNPTKQMPPIEDFQMSVFGPTSALQWVAGQGSAKIEQVGGPVCRDDPSVTPSECQHFVTVNGCASDATWCRLCAKSCGEHGTQCGCTPQHPPVWRDCVVGMDLMWQANLTPKAESPGAESAYLLV